MSKHATQYAVMGASGNTGKVVARELLEHGQKVRVIARREEGVKDLVAKGAEFFCADSNDVNALTKALQGVDAAYVMHSSNLMSENILADSKATTLCIRQAIIESGVKHIVVLSSYGAQHASGTGNIITNRWLEESMTSLPIRVGILRPGSFMENYSSVVPVMKAQQILPSFFTPLDKRVELIATEDVGVIAAEMLLGTRPLLVELSGPVSYTPADVALAFSAVLEKAITAVPVAKSDIANFLKGLPSSTIAALSEALEGINSGHITFEGREFEFVRGRTTVQDFAKRNIQ